MYNANSAIFQLYHGGNKVNFQWNDDEVSFVLDQHALLDFYSASALKQQSAPQSPHYPDSEPTSFLLNATYQLYSLWLDPTGARTHDQPHSRRAR